jgi:hypothetical protein
MQTYSTPTSNGPSTASDASATDQAKDKAQQAAGQAKEQAQQAAGQAKGALRTQVDQRSTQAGQQVGTFASDVRSVGDQLRQQGKDQPAKLADQAAERAERVSNYLTQSDADRILHDVEDFGRRQPWMVIAGGALLGLAASRFLKASSTRRYDQRFESSNRLPARTSDVSPTGTGLYTGTAAGTGQYGTGTGTGQYAGTGEAAPFTTPPVGPGSFEEGR